MKQQGKGSIVMISSANSVIYHSKRSLYNVSKSATAGMAGTLGVELARFGIRVNSVGPGYVATDLVKAGVENGTMRFSFRAADCNTQARRLPHFWRKHKRRGRLCI